MSAIASTPPVIRNSLLRTTLLGGMITGILHSIIFHWLVSSLILKNPLSLVYQFIASGILGNAAFEGGLATALLGVLLNFLISIIIAGIFILSADRIPLLRRYAIVGSLLYGFGVFIIMSFVVMPLSATPPMPPPTPLLLAVSILEHILVIGLPLGILVRRNSHN